MRLKIYQVNSKLTKIHKDIDIANGLANNDSDYAYNWVENQDNPQIDENDEWQVYQKFNSF